MILLFILFFQQREVSIWLGPDQKGHKIFVDGKPQIPLWNSTPSNFRFKTNKKEFELMLAAPGDTLRKQVELTKDLTVITF